MSVLTGVAAMFYRHSFKVERSSGFYNDGRYDRSDPETHYAKGNFMAASARQLMRLPEGYRADGVQTLYTAFELRTAESPNQPADRVIFNGIAYQVTTSSGWTSHRWYLLAKVGQ